MFEGIGAFFLGFVFPAVIGIVAYYYLWLPLARQIRERVMSGLPRAVLLLFAAAVLVLAFFILLIVPGCVLGILILGNLVDGIIGNAKLENSSDTE